MYRINVYRIKKETSVELHVYLFYIWVIFVVIRVHIFVNLIFMDYYTIMLTGTIRRHPVISKTSPVTMMAVD